MDDHGMTSTLYAMLLQWLDSGSDVQKRHAAFRLAQPDAVELADRTPEVRSLPAYPAWTAMAGNLASAVGGVVSAAVHGEAIVASEEEQARRLAICHACESYDPVGGRCRDCGCYLSWKTRIASQHCPLDPPKW